MKPFTAWIAFSDRGHPAWFLGYHPSRIALRQEYSRRFLSKLEDAGYKAVRMRLSHMNLGIKVKP